MEFEDEGDGGGCQVDDGFSVIYPTAMNVVKVQPCQPPTGESQREYGHAAGQWKCARTMDLSFSGQ